MKTNKFCKMLAIFTLLNTIETPADAALLSDVSFSRDLFVVLRNVGTTYHSPGLIEGTGDNLPLVAGNEARAPDGASIIVQYGFGNNNATAYFNILTAFSTGGYFGAR